jgi:hypothetical protein
VTIVRTTNLVVLVVLALSLAGACASEPPTVVEPSRSERLPVAPTAVASVEPPPSPSAIASSSPSSAPLAPVPPEPPARADLPPPPAPVEATGAAAIVWVPDEKAPNGVRSVWIEPDGRGVKAAAQREGMVFVGREQLWALGVRDVKLTTPPCNDPQTRCNPHPEIREPFLRSLASGRVLPSPWRQELGISIGCDRTFDVGIDGMVGTVAFARIWRSDVGCGSHCPMHGEHIVTFDVDTGAEVKLDFPGSVVGALREHARSTLGQVPFATCTELPEYRATGAYDAQGQLEGVYEFGDSHSGICGTAIHCPNVVERASWLPRALAPWGKLPVWVGDFMGASKAEFAAMISQKRVVAARKEFARSAER